MDYSQDLQLPTALLAVYWWNPLVVKEIFNSGHMDVLALPFVLGAVWLSLKGRVGGSLFALSLGVGAKLWPLALMPLVVRPWYRKPVKLAAGLGLFGLALAALFLLSPAQFPWYFTMLAPFLVMYPQPSLVLLTAVLPLYYLRYYFLALGRVDWFDYGLVWLEYLPVCLMIIWEWRSGYRPATARLAERSAP